jgi:hypothetical protein
MSQHVPPFRATGPPGLKLAAAKEAWTRAMGLLVAKPADRDQLRQKLTHTCPQSCAAGAQIPIRSVPSQGPRSMASQPWNFAHVIFTEAPVKPDEHMSCDEPMTAHITSGEPESRHEVQSRDQRLDGVLDSTSEDLHGRAGTAAETEIGTHGCLVRMSGRLSAFFFSWGLTGLGMCLAHSPLPAILKAIVLGFVRNVGIQCQLCYLLSC